MPYFGIGYFSNDEKQINISHRWLQDMRTRTRNKLKPAAAFVTRLTLRSPPLTRPHWLKIVSNDQMRSDAGVPGDLATIRVTMIRPGLNRDSHDMWPTSADVSGLLRDTAWQQPGKMLIDWRTRGYYQSSELMSLWRFPALFHVCILPGWEIYEMQKLLKFRWLWLPAQNWCARGLELKWPQMCIFIFGDIYILVGTEV